MSVIIVGGGVSGLTFAYRCHLNRIPFTLIEASERFGGRIFSQETETSVAERGAQFIDHDHSYIIQLIKELNLNLLQHPIPWFHNHHHSFFQDQLDPIFDKEMFHSLLSKIHEKKDFSSSCDSFFEKENVSLIERKFLTSKIRNLEGTEPETASIESLKYQLEWILSEKNHIHYRIEGGNEKLTQKLSSLLPQENLILNSPILQIDKVAQNYSVKTEQQTFVGKTLILALPLMPLKNLIPSSFIGIREAINCFQLGQNEKMFFTYRKTSLIDKIPENITMDTEYGGLWAEHYNLRKQNKLTSFILYLGGGLAQKRHDPTFFRRHVSSCLAKLCHCSFKDIDKLFYQSEIFSSWNNSSFQGGSYTGANHPNLIQKANKIKKMILDKKSLEMESNLYCIGEVWDFERQGHMDSAVKTAEMAFQEFLSNNV